MGLLGFGSLSWFEFEQLCFGFALLTKTFQEKKPVERLDISQLSLLLSCVSPPSTLTSSSLFQ